MISKGHFFPLTLIEIGFNLSFRYLQLYNHLNGVEFDNRV